MNSETFDIPALAALLPGDALPALLLVAFLGSALGFLVLARAGRWAGPLAAVLPAGLFAAAIANGIVPVSVISIGVARVGTEMAYIPFQAFMVRPPPALPSPRLKRPPPQRPPK